MVNKVVGGRVQVVPGRGVGAQVVPGRDVGAFRILHGALHVNNKRVKGRHANKTNVFFVVEPLRPPKVP